MLSGIDIYGEVIPRDRYCGGDHIIYIDFNQRYDLDTRIAQVLKRNDSDENRAIVQNLKANRHKAGILLADVKGHDFSDAILVGMLHQAFLTGVLYELEHKGHVTTTLFEILNTRFYRSSSIDDFLTMIYGEINEKGLFKFISAGHPKPLIFSKKFDRFVQIADEIVVNYPPIGLMPSPGNFDTIPCKSILGIKEKYTISTLNLMGSGDILLLYTDGLSDLTDSRNQPFLPNILETIFKDTKDKSSRLIFNTVKDCILKNSQTIQDDISYVIVKKKVPD